MFCKRFLVAVCLAIGISSAFAAPKDSLYLGGEFQVNKFAVENNIKFYNANLNSSKAIKKSLNGLSIFIGYRWNEFAMEFGSTYIRKVNYSGYDMDEIVSISVNTSQNNYN